MTEKITIMVLKVDLQCSCCYKKVKKLLCKFPQNKLSLSSLVSCDTYSGTREIRDQVYDEKQNTVTITVLCCNPEKILDKLCCKGGKVIKSIEIKSPPKLKEPEMPKAPVEKPEKPKPNVKPPPSTPAEKPTPKAPPMVPIPVPVAAPKGPQPVVPIPVPVAAPKGPQPVVPIPVPVVTGHGCPSIFPYEPCCGSCSQGRTDGPCYQGYGRLPNFYDNNYGYNNNNYNNGSYGGGYNDINYGEGRPCHARRPCDYYSIGDNTSSSACIIM